MTQSLGIILVPIPENDPPLGGTDNGGELSTSPGRAQPHRGIAASEVCTHSLNQNLFRTVKVDAYGGRE